MSEQGHLHWRGIKHLGEYVCYDCGATVPTSIDPAEVATLRASFAVPTREPSAFVHEQASVPPFTLGHPEEHSNGE